MTQPYDTGFHVGTQALRDEAELWDDRGARIGFIQSSVDALQFSPPYMPERVDFVAAYQALQIKLMDRCRAGGDEMSGIAEALRWVAERYEFVDRRNEARLLGIQSELVDYGRGDPR
jgi:hypothetical protein